MIKKPIKGKNTIENVRENEFTIYFLPWAGTVIKKAIKIGPVTFWPYFSESNQRINNTKLRSYLDKFFKSYVDLQGKPVDTIVICSFDNKLFCQLTKSESNKLKEAINSLTFITIAPEVVSWICNNDLPPPASNVFELLTFYSSPKKEYITVKKSANASNSGLKIENLTFSRPLEASGKVWKLSKELIDGFNKCFSTRLPQNERERLFRSLEWFKLAHVEGDQISDFSRTVMMVTAFEILFDFSEKDHNKSGKLAECIEKCIVAESSDPEQFIKETHDIDDKKRSHRATYTLAGWWAWNFYKIRDKIVHGDLVSSSDLQYKGLFSQLVVADLVFWECIKHELFKYKCIGDKVRSSLKKINKTDSNESKKIEAIIIEYALGFDRVHETLGWLRKNRK